MSASPQTPATAEKSKATPTVASFSILGERSVPSVNTERTAQSRVNTVVALAVVLMVGGGFLFWWYQRQFQGAKEVRIHVAQERAAKAQGDSRPPPLGTVAPPDKLVDKKTDPTPTDVLLGPPPPLPPRRAVGVDDRALPNAGEESEGHDAGSPPRPGALHRRLSEPVLYRASSGTSSSSAVPDHIGEVDAATGVARWEAILGASSNAAASNAPSATGPVSGTGLGNYLNPTPTVAVQARVLPTQRFLLPKGSFVDCTLETALNSQLPGLATCVTAYDIFGADGHVVLLERGSKLTGETKGETRAGMTRLFVLWTEARTPTGVVVELASPGTDELGRSGLSGSTDTHFWERFGAAILVTVIDGAVQAAANSTQSSSGNTSVNLNPQNTSSIATEVLRNTLAIPPTIVKNQGDRIQILVARDLDFRSVYALRTP